MLKAGKSGKAIKIKSLILVAVLMVFSAGAAIAVPKGTQVEFASSALGNVIFNGAIHAGIGKLCEDCHNLSLFPMQKKGVANISMKDMMEGNFCGFCHNGKVAFGVDANCMKCHKQQ